MKFDKLHSHNSTPKTVEFASTTKSTFVPPPLGLDIVTMPNNKIFDLFLKGSISAKQMLKMDHNDIDNVPRIAPRRQQTRHKSIKNQADQIFSLVERFQQQRKQSVIIAQNPKPSHPPKLQRKETLMQLTSSTKELIQPIQQSRFRAPVRKFSQRSTSSGKEEQLIKRCEKLSGERLNVEEKNYYQKDITDEDAWRMMNVFQKKNDQQSKQQQSQQEIKVQAQPISLFQKLRNTVLKQTEVKRKPEKQCQEYYNHIQNIEDQIKYHVFNRDLPEQIRNQQKPSVKMYRSESEVSKLNIRNKFIEAADKFSINQSNPQVLKDFLKMEVKLVDPNLESQKLNQLPEKFKDLNYQGKTISLMKAKEILIRASLNSDSMSCIMKVNYDKNNINQNMTLLLLIMGINYRGK